MYFDFAYLAYDILNMNKYDNNFKDSCTLVLMSCFQQNALSVKLSVHGIKLYALKPFI